MALSAVELRRVVSDVGTLLRVEIHGEFAALYAAAVSAAEKHPEQINNEIRNAVTHLARAVAAPDVATANAEIAKAASHIERAKRDAIKIAVVVLRDRIADACSDLRRLEGTVDPALIARRDEIHKERKQLLQDEARGAPVINGFGQLYLKADQLHDDLLGLLARSGRRRSQWTYRWIAWRRIVIGWSVGLAIGILGSMAYSIMAPDSAAFGHAARRWMGLPPQKVEAPKPTPAPPPKPTPKPSAASSPSTAAKPGDPAQPRQ